MKETCSVDLELKAFFVLLPFAYVLQVLLFSRYAALLLYLPLLPAAAKAALPLLRGAASGARPSASGALVLLLMCCSVYSAAAEFMVAGPGAAAKLALTLLMPPLLFFLLRDHASEEGVNWLVAALTAGAALMAANEIYEFFKTTPTLYEARNFAYIKAMTGSEAGRWSGGALRPGGLLDHVHAAPFFISFGLLAALSRWLRGGGRRYLAAGAICAAGLVGSGMRMPVLAAGVTAVLAVMLEGRGVLSSGPRRRLLVFIGACCIAAAALYALTWRRDAFWNLYIHPLTTGELIPGGDFMDDVAAPQFRDIWEKISAGPFQLLFGYGLSSSWAVQQNVFTDDLFALTILGGGGLFGFAVIYALFFSAGRHAVAALRRLPFERRGNAQLAAGMLCILFLSTLHSGIFLRRAIYPLFFFAAALAARYGGEERR